MPTQHSVRQRRSTSTTLAGALCAVALVATACGTSGGDATVGDAPTVPEAPDAAPAVTHETASVPGALQYGDSIADVLPTPLTANESTAAVIPGFRPVEWEELVDPNFSGAQIAEKYGERIGATKPGSPAMDALYEEMNAEYDSASVNAALDSEDIQLVGFIAPITYDGDSIIEFLLVPYFGACIHVPAPPANQTVMVSLAEGERLSLDDSWHAIWVAGTVTTTMTGTDLATAGYTISDAQFGVYDSF